MDTCEHVHTDSIIEGNHVRVICCECATEIDSFDMEGPPHEHY